MEQNPESCNCSAAIRQEVRPVPGSRKKLFQSTRISEFAPRTDATTGTRQRRLRCRKLKDPARGQSVSAGSGKEGGAAEGRVEPQHRSSGAEDHHDGHVVNRAGNARASRARPSRNRPVHCTDRPEPFSDHKVRFSPGRLMRWRLKGPRYPSSALCSREKLSRGDLAFWPARNPSIRVNSLIARSVNGSDPVA